MDGGSTQRGAEYDIVSSRRPTIFFPFSSRADGTKVTSQREAPDDVLVLLSPPGIILRPAWCCSGSGTMRVQQSCSRRRRQPPAKLSSCHLTACFAPKAKHLGSGGSHPPVKFVWFKLATRDGFKFAHKVLFKYYYYSPILYKCDSMHPIPKYGGLAPTLLQVVDYLYSQNNKRVTCVC
jgi:hypothetical protein